MDCKNTLKALKEAGFYESDEEILTYSDYNKKMGYEDNDPPVQLYED